MAQSFIAEATMSAIEGSSGTERSMVASSARKTALGRRACMTERLKTFLPKRSPSVSLSAKEAAGVEYEMTVSMACWRAAVPLMG
jgi:hypothetical protein